MFVWLELWRPWSSEYVLNEQSKLLFWLDFGKLPFTLRPNKTYWQRKILVYGTSLNITCEWLRFSGRCVQFFNTPEFFSEFQSKFALTHLFKNELQLKWLQRFASAHRKVTRFVINFKFTDSVLGKIATFTFQRM